MTSLVPYQKQVESILIENENVVNHDEMPLGKAIPVATVKVMTPCDKKEQEVMPLREMTTAVGEQGVPEMEMPVKEADCCVHAVVLQLN